MVTRTGFEPVNDAVKGRCVKPLHQRAIYNQEVNLDVLVHYSKAQGQCQYNIYQKTHYFDTKAKQFSKLSFRTFQTEFLLSQ